MESIRGGLSKLLKEVVRSAPAEDGPMLAWVAVCGSSVASRTRALEFADGILRVEVPDSGWKRQLEGFSKRYLTLMDQVLPGKVTRIVFVPLHKEDKPAWVERSQ